MDKSEPDDELDKFWLRHFGRRVAPIERHLIADFEKTVGAEDPLFPVLMMQTYILHERLSSTEKAVLARGPELETRMELLSLATEKVVEKIRGQTMQLDQLSAASDRLLAAHDRLSQQRALEARWEVVPLWVAVGVSSAATAVLMLIGALAFAVAT